MAELKDPRPSPVCIQGKILSTNQKAARVVNVLFIRLLHCYSDHDTEVCDEETATFSQTQHTYVHLINYSDNAKTKTPRIRENRGSRSLGYFDLYHKKPSKVKE